MTNVVQCSLMQNNESGSEGKKKKKKREKTLATCKLKHTHTQKNKTDETNKKERKIKLRVCPFLKGILCNAQPQDHLRIRKQVKVWTNYREDMEEEMTIITFKEKMLNFCRSVLNFSVQFGP